MTRKARLWDFSREIDGSVVYVMVEGEPIDEDEMVDRVSRAVAKVAEGVKRMDENL